MKIASHIAVILFLLAPACPAQVPVALSPVAHVQFLDNSGKPLANGCVFTYQAGTSTLQATYVDNGGVTQNADPIVLDAGGFADIWLPNQAFKFTVKSAGGVQCASGSQIWSKDNITNWLGLTGQANSWSAQQTYALPLIISATSVQIVTGS